MEFIFIDNMIWRIMFLIAGGLFIFMGIWLFSREASNEQQRKQKRNKKSPRSG